MAIVKLVEKDDEYFTIGDLIEDIKKNQEESMKPELFTALKDLSEEKRKTSSSTSSYFPLQTRKKLWKTSITS